MNNKLITIFSIFFIFFLVQCKETNQSVKSQNKFLFWTVGSSDINTRFGVKIYNALDSLEEETGLLDEFLFTIAEEPLTINQITERSGISQGQTEFIINYLDSCNFIRKFDQNKWATILPVITDYQMKIIRKDLAQMANNIAQYLRNEAEQIKNLYNKVKSPTDPAWNKISHLIIDKFIIDASFHKNLNKLKRESDESENNNSGKSIMPAFLMHRGENFSNFGSNWYEFKKGEDQREVFVLHGAVLNRYDIALNKYKWDKEFSASLFKISTDNRLDSLNAGEREMYSDLGWISGDSLSVPILEANTLKSMLPLLENIGKEAAEIAFTEFSDLSDSYNKSSYSEFIDYKEDYIQVLIHSLFGLTIEQLVKTGVVSKVPKPVPDYFGVFIVKGKTY